MDASALLRALIDDGELGHVARTRVGRSDVHVPHLLDVEIASALRRLVDHGAIAPSAADAVLRQVAHASLQRFPHWPFLPRIWELRDNLTAYDAAYVALAEALGAPLVTTDARLSKAPDVRCEVELLAVA